jgi:hypothetical protein
MLMQYKMKMLAARAITLIIFPGVNSAPVNPPLISTTSPQFEESQTVGNSTIFIVPSVLVLTLVVLNCLYFKKPKRRNPERYVAGSSFTDSEALDGDGNRESENDPNVLNMEAIVPISMVSEGDVIGSGQDKIKIMSRIDGGGFGDVWKAKFRGKDVAGLIFCISYFRASEDNQATRKHASPY